MIKRSKEFIHTRRIDGEKTVASPAPVFMAFNTLVTRFRREEAGEGFIDVLVKMLIVVVVGAVLLTIMRQAIPQLFTDMLTKIRDIFEV